MYFLVVKMRTLINVSWFAFCEQRRNVNIAKYVIKKLEHEFLYFQFTCTIF